MLKRVSSRVRFFSSKANDTVLSLNEALYLAHKLGISSIKERQEVIMRSPPFSPDASPFLMENFFSEEKTEDAIPAENSEERVEKKEIHEVDERIHKRIAEAFSDQRRVKTFFANGKEWLAESEGRGTNRRASAHVKIVRGAGVVKVNGEEDFYYRWPFYAQRLHVIQPLFLTRMAGFYDLLIEARGGGISGQANATRLALGRALANACPASTEDMKYGMILFEDTRQKISKFPGRMKARKKKKWSKR